MAKFLDLPVSHCLMRLGIDLGGTKIEGAVLDLDGEIIARRRIATPRDSYTAIVSSVADLIKTLEVDVSHRCTIGVGMPGIHSPHTGLVKNSNTTVLNGKALDRDLAKLLDREIRFENDANCFVLSEAVDGAAQGHGCVFGVILGTGTGGGMAIDRRILSGRNRIAGEWGHNPLPWPNENERNGSECHCGRVGCLETYLSGEGLRRAFGGRHLDGPDAIEIASLADSGDPRAVSALETYVDRLARGLASVVNIVDPDIIVLGGGLSNISMVYTLAPPIMQRYAFSDHLTTPIVPARHGDSSGVRGAAWLWPN